MDSRRRRWNCLPQVVLHVRCLYLISCAIGKAHCAAVRLRDVPEEWSNVPREARYLYQAHEINCKRDHDSGFLA